MQSSRDRAAVAKVPTSLAPRLGQAIDARDDAPGAAKISTRRLLRIDQIVGRDGILGIGKTKFYEAISDGLIPPPVKFGTASLWDAAAIKAVVGRILAGEFGAKSPNKSTSQEAANVPKAA